MNADLKLLYPDLDYDQFPQRSKNWAKLLSISLPSSRRGHPGLAKYHTIWATFSRYFLLDSFSLAYVIWIVNAYIRHYGRFLTNYINHLNSFIVKGTEFVTGPVKMDQVGTLNFTIFFKFVAS